METGGEREARIVFKRISGVGSADEIIGTDIEGELAGLPFKPLGGMEEFGVHVGLEAGREGMAAFAPRDFHHAARQVAIFHGGDAAHHFHTLDVIGGEAAHVDTLIGEVAREGAAIGGARHILHVGICANTRPVDYEGGAEG